MKKLLFLSFFTYSCVSVDKNIAPFETITNIDQTEIEKISCVEVFNSYQKYLNNLKEKEVKLELKKFFDPNNPKSFAALFWYDKEDKDHFLQLIKITQLNGSLLEEMPFYYTVCDNQGVYFEVIAK